VGGPADAIAVAFPAIGFAAFVGGALLLGFHRFLAAAIAASMVAVSVIATVEPRLRVATPAPTPGIVVVAANVLRDNRHPQRAADTAAARGADVIAAVEMGDAFARGMLAHRDRYPYAAVSGEQAIWSRWPIEALPVPDGLPADRVMRAGIEVEGVSLIVYAVHLYNPLHETSIASQRQMIDDLARAIGAESVPTVLAGDLNLSDRSAAYRVLEAEMLDAMRSARWAEGTYRFGLWRTLMLRIDHLFVPPDWCSSDATTFLVPGSDHRGIKATVGPCPS
jgi:endonuclease/exonuclease/phosphatase (EEP) superfamily protein YafD